MQERFARVRTAKLAGATCIFSVVAVAAATPTSLHTATDQAILAAVEPAQKTRDLTSGSVKIGNSVDTVRIERPAKGDLAPIGHRTFAKVEHMPSSGQIATFEIAGINEDALPASKFSKHPDKAVAGVDDAAQAAFAKPGAAPSTALVVAARVPQTKPTTAKARRGEGVETARVLAYAPEPITIHAPFDAVLGGHRNKIVAQGEGEPNIPRSRPDPEQLLVWLDGRALGQFAPGQHDWVKSPLPEIVHSAKEQKCLAEGIYFEARGEPEAGQAAVAQVILNRVRNPTYPDTICDVVYQNENWLNRCQFSFACDGIANTIRSGPAWSIARRIGRDVTEGKIWIEEVGDSTHYYADYVRPRWAGAMNKMEQIGAHLFYRTRKGGWS